MCRSMVDIHSATAEIRRGKKKIETTGKNIMPSSATQGSHNENVFGDSKAEWRGPGSRPPASTYGTCYNRADQHPLPTPLPSSRRHLSNGDCVEVRGKIIGSVLCNIVCNNCAQCNADTLTDLTRLWTGDWVLSHWAHFTVLRFILCMYVCIFCMTSSKVNVTFITTKDAACHEYVNNQND